MNLRYYWQKITDLGLEEGDLGREVIKVRLLNQLIAVAFFTSFLVFLTYIAAGDRVMTILVSINLTLEGLALLLSYRKQFVYSRLVASIIFPTWIGIAVAISGGGFSEGNIFIGLGFAAFILFEGKKRNQVFVVAYISLLYVASKIYAINAVSVQNKVYNPYDEIITFPLILIILGLIIFVYQREIKKYEAQHKKWIRDLKFKNKELTQINEELEQFTYIASHDLKTPLRSLNNHVGLARRHIKKQNFEAVTEDLKYIEIGAKQMYSLINDILEYKSVYSSTDPIEPINLNQLCTEVIQTQTDVLVEKNGKITMLNDLPKVNARRTDFFILFQHLIENGLKFNTSPTPLVEISSFEKDDILTIVFKDNGIGIAPEYHSRVFSFFKKLHTSDKYAGNGIGLGLCQKIVKQYQGKIELESDVGKGSIFTITFLKSELILEDV